MCHLVQLERMFLGDWQIVAIEAVEDELVGGGGHMVGIAAYTTAQLHIFLMGYLPVAFDDDLRGVDQREQRRAQGIHADALLLVGDARRASDVGVEHGVDE